LLDASGTGEDDTKVVVEDRRRRPMVAMMDFIVYEVFMWYDDMI